jgi:hypothetical protein
MRQTLDRLENGLLLDLYGTTLHNEKLLQGIACQQLMLMEGLVGSSKRIESGHVQEAIISSTTLAVPNHPHPSSSGVLWSLPFAPERMLAIEKCHGVCTCMCHRPSKTATPAFLSSLLGQAHLRYTAAAQSGRLCNKRLSRRQRSYELRLNYKLPSWLASNSVADCFVSKVIQMCRFLMQHGADAYYETSLRR